MHQECVFVLADTIKLGLWLAKPAQVHASLVPTVQLTALAAHQAITFQPITYVCATTAHF